MLALFHRYIFRVASALLVAAMAATVASCGTSRTVTASAVHSGNGKKAEHTSAQPKSAGSKADKGASTGSSSTNKPLARIDFSKLKLNSVSEKLLREADSWIGTAYLYGGNDRQGVDCSGFVVQVFKNSLGINLPRTSSQQQTFCDSIARSDLYPGDLVFFTVRGSRTVGHVGIYIGDNQFVHASSSKGVIISSLDWNYYVANYFSSGRVGRYYAMCDVPRTPKQTPAAAKPRVTEPAAAPVVVEPPVQPAPTVYAVAEQPAADDDELTAEEQTAVRARVAMRVARFGNTQQETK